MEKKKGEAATLQKKKTTINRAKVKKTIKNTLCRPDPVFWPIIAEEQAKMLEATLASHKIEVPVFKKLPWKELMSIPKDKRPKPPKIKKVEGFIFGLLESTEGLKNNQCSALIIDASVNPRAILQPLIEACISKQVPVICLNGLKTTAKLNFGIATSCLAVKNGFLQELTSKIKTIAKLFELPKPLIEKDVEEFKFEIENTPIKMEVAPNTEQVSSTPFQYLYRSSKNIRAFNPSQEEPKAKKAFIGQDFIEFSEKTEQKPPNTTPYKTMILKKITNNQNRTKKK